MSASLSRGLSACQGGARVVSCLLRSCLGGGPMFPLPPLTDEQRALVERAAALARERFAPRAAKYDTESSFPYENYAELREAGLLALTVPKDYGGLGADPIAYAQDRKSTRLNSSHTVISYAVF